MMHLKKLPIGIQSFSEIITGGYAYVDKTPFIAELVNGGKYYFLSRPRRFGKSLLIDTIDCAFSGRKDLFSGLFLDSPESGWDFSMQYPVIRISLAQRINSTAVDLCNYISHIIIREAKKFDYEIFQSYSPGFQLDDLIRHIYQTTGKQVVLLIDEYDKPILDSIEEPIIAGTLRDELKSFYGVIKDLDPYLKFVFMTGVSKFAKTGIFSGLNNLDDITIDTRYSALCGYTQTDLETVFA
ncbi:AAA family ATPase, partial [Methanospirillum purgamenti]|uniref:ATP-binding protein n=1 Tax=Methanospirillum purgamenti TaxID=2834276 RepID=UPI002A308FE6|nr:AAA family ATPase [Methanospirillum hungatei]